LLAFVAAEAREFSGLLRRAERVNKLDWPVDFARRVWLNGRAAVLVANGPGPKLAAEAVEIAKGHEELTGLVSTGFCGALDPALKACDIFVATEILSPPNPHYVGQAILPAAGIPAGLDHAGSKAGGRQKCLPHKLLSIDRVASTVAEKRELYATTGAAAIEMEAAAVAEKAKEYNLPFYCIRVVTDTATESFPLDFNRMRDANGRFSRTKIVAAALRRPSIFPKLIELNKRCKLAAEALGDFIADTRF
jgi:adenosylhomocysteine nucleosidase